MASEKKYHKNAHPKTGALVKDEEAEIDIKPKLGFFYFIAVTVVGGLSKLIYPQKISGKELIPKTGNVIFACTHSNYLDAIFSVCTCGRPVYTFAKIELFKKSFFKMLFSHLGCIPVDRQKRNSGSLKLAEDKLKNGANLMIFPEGTRSKTGGILPLKFGAVSLAKKTGAVIVPVVITGKPKLFHRSVRVQYLEPIKPMSDLEKYNQKLHVVFSETRALHLRKNASKIPESNSWLQTILEKPILWLVKTIYRPKMSGEQNVPKNGAMVLAANHKHVFDQFLPELTLKKGQRSVNFAKIEYSRHPIWRLMKHFNVVFVDRETKDKSMSIQYTNEKIQKGNALVIFPEGTRNKTSKILKTFKYGAVSFAFHNKIPLIPVAIIGKWKPFGKNLKVQFGKPIKVKSKADYANANKKLYNSIQKMLIDGGEAVYRKEIFSHYQKKGF